MNIKMRRAVSVFAAVILIAVVLSGCLGGGGGAWVPKVGDFLEYSSSGLMGLNATTRWEIKSVTDDNMTVNITLSVQGMPSAHQEQTVPKDDLFGQGFDINNPPAGINVTKVGTEQLSTKWGLRSAVHYIATYQGNPSITDIWIRSGIVLRTQIAAMNQTMTVILTDTNISQIVNP